MEVNNDTLLYLSKLAHLELKEEEKADLINDLNRILAFVDQLSDVDTTGVKPLVFINEEEFPLRNDVVAGQITQEEALRNAPQKNKDFFLVPKVIG